MNGRSVFWAALVGLVVVTSARADVVIDWVTVGDAGNVGELSGEGAGGFGPTRVCGAVSYTYQIGKYEVTNGQYIGFLNAVAAADPHGLYDTRMGMAGVPGGISRSGTPGSYTYGPKGGDANWLTKPVNWVDWYTTLRFANWLHNEQPTGPQDDFTTEDGAYDMSLGFSVTRKAGAQVFLPNEDEWYKAAFYKGGGTNAGYWDYATRSNLQPQREPPPGGSDSANYAGFGGELVIGPPYYLNDVGAYSQSVSAYGTFDQNGNIFEWNESRVEPGYRGLRGGSYDLESEWLPASCRSSDSPGPAGFTGFRVASIPEPGTIALLTIGIAVLLSPSGPKKQVTPAPAKAWAHCLIGAASRTSVPLNIVGGLG